MMKQYGWLLGLLLIAPQAFAEAQVPAATAVDGMGTSAISQGVLLAAFALIFYFLFIRPQSKRAKEHQKLVTGLQKGDEVITTGGLLGKITHISDSFFMMMISEGVEVPVQRHAIASVVPKGTMHDIRK